MSASRTGAFIPRKYSRYSFSLGAESTLRPWYGRKEYVTEKSSDITGNRSRDRPTVAQRLNHYATPGPTIPCVSTDGKDVQHTGCPRRNGQNFGRVFLMLKYTAITQNTYVQSWTVTEIKDREKCGLFAVPRTVPGSRDVIPIRCALSVLVYSWLKRVPRCDCTCKGQLWRECECFCNSI